MQAIILAGGISAKQQTSGGNFKPMAPVAGVPFLCHVIEYMAGQGVREVMLCINQRSSHVMRYFGPRYAGVRIKYSVEEYPLGTGGAIRRALQLLNPQKPVFVANGDCLVEVDYRRMYAVHRQKARPVTMACAVVPSGKRYGKVKLRGGRIVQFDIRGQAMHCAVSAGLYVIWPGLFENFTLPEVFSFETNFLAPYAPQLQPAAYAHVPYFIDIGIASDYARAQAEVPERMAERVAA